VNRPSPSGAPRRGLPGPASLRRFFAALAAGAAILASAAPAEPPAPGTPLGDVAALTAPEMAGRATGTDGGRRARAYLAQRFADLGLAPLGTSFVHPFSFKLRDGRAFADAANVLGAVRGTRDPDRWLVISAHYDHLGIVDGAVYPGADDNASGVAAVLALAAHFKAHPPAHSIAFACFDAEELSLQGARAFLARPPVPVERIAAVLNLDMVSAGHRNEIYLAGTHHRPWLRPIVDPAVRRAAVKVLYGHDAPPNSANKLEDWTFASDHGPFHLAGIPFVYFGVEDHPDYHRPTDTFARLNRDFFARVLPLFVDVAAVLDRELAAIARAAER
jgi:hypothetical protein